MRIGLIQLAITAVVIGFVFRDKLFKKAIKEDNSDDILKDESDIIEGEIISDDTNANKP